MTDIVEVLSLRKKTNFEGSSCQVTVRAVADLLLCEQHDLLRDADETDAEYVARVELFGALINHARTG